MKSSILFALGLSVLISSSAFAVKEGGGGDVVVLPDGSVVLADPFLNASAQQPDGALPPELTLNPVIISTMQNYLDAANPHLYGLAQPNNSAGIYDTIGKLWASAADLKNYYQSGPVHIYGVQSTDELNLNCASGGRKQYQLPSGAKAEQVACTDADSTFVVVPIFNQLDLKNQALLLMHERLTTIHDSSGAKNYAAIADFTRGMGVYVDIYKDQSQDHFNSLDDTQIQSLTRLFSAIHALEYPNERPLGTAPQWISHPIGGGRVDIAATIDPTAFVSVDSVMNASANLEAASVAVGFSDNLLSNIAAACREPAPSLHLGAHASIIRSAFKSNIGLATFGCEDMNSLYDREQSLAETKTSAGSISLNAGAIVKDSIIQAWTASFGTGSDIEKSNINFPGVLRVSSDQKMSSGKITGDSGSFYPVGVTVKPIHLQWTDITSSTFKLDDNTQGSLAINGGLFVTPSNVWPVDFIPNTSNNPSAGNVLIHYNDSSWPWSQISETVQSADYDINMVSYLNQDSDLWALTDDGQLAPAGNSRQALFWTIDPSKVDSKLMAFIKAEIELKLNSAGLKFQYRHAEGMYGSGSADELLVNLPVVN